MAAFQHIMCFNFSDFHNWELFTKSQYVLGSRGEGSGTKNGNSKC